MKAILVLMLCVASTYAAPSVQHIQNVVHQVVPIIQGLVQGGIQGLIFALLQHVPAVQLQLANIHAIFTNAMSQFHQQVQSLIALINGRNTKSILDQLVAVANNVIAQAANALLNTVANAIGKRDVDAKIFSTIGSIFGTVVDTVVTGVSNTVSAIGTAVGTVVTGVIETAQPHVDNLLTELQGHAENAIQSVTNTIAGINQGLGY